MKKGGVIYQILHLESRKGYVGSTNEYIGRWRTHRSDLRNNRHHSSVLQEAWNKYGERAFAFNIIEWVEDSEQLLFRERYWGSKLDCSLNLCAPGSKGGPKPENFSEIMSKATKGKPISEAQRIVRRINLVSGQINSPANKPGWIPEHRIGVKDSPEIIEKRRQTKLSTEHALRQQGIHRIWINDGMNADQIIEGSPIPDGWSIGRPPSFSKNASISRRGEKRSNVAKANMSTSASNAWQDPAKREAMLSARRPFRWMTNGKTDQKLFDGDLLPEGFRFGRTNGLNPHGRAGKPGKPTVSKLNYGDTINIPGPAPNIAIASITEINIE